jgi:hypothetical protein
MKKLQWLILTVTLASSLPIQMVYGFQNGNTPTPTGNKSESKNKDLSEEIKNLTNEIRKLNNSQEQVVNLMIIQFAEGKIEKIQEKQKMINDKYENIRTQQERLESRLSHIDDELTMRNIVNRQEGEKIIKTEIQRELSFLRIERDAVERDNRQIRQSKFNLIKLIGMLHDYLVSKEEDESRKKYNFDKLVENLLDLSDSDGQKY